MLSRLGNVSCFHGFPSGSVGKESRLRMQETQIQSLGWEAHLRRQWQPIPVFLPGEFHRQRNLVGYCPWGHKELDMTEQLSSCVHRGEIWSVNGTTATIPWTRKAIKDLINQPVILSDISLQRVWPLQAFRPSHNNRLLSWELAGNYRDSWVLAHFSVLQKLLQILVRGQGLFSVFPDVPTAV